MPAHWVVATLDPSKDRQSSLGLGFAAAPGNELTLQAGKEALCHSVVISITDSAHRGSYAHFLAALAKGYAGVLATLIAVMNHRLGLVRVIKAMLSAKTTKSAVMRSPNAQPTTLRLYTSITTDKYSNPAQVGM